MNPYLQATIIAVIVTSIILIYGGLYTGKFYEIYMKHKKPKLRMVYNGFKYGIQQKSNFFPWSWKTANTVVGYMRMVNYETKSACEKDYAELHDAWDRKVAKFKVIDSYVDTDLYKKMNGGE